MNLRSVTAERWLFGAVVVLGAAPLLLGTYLPFLDLPQHLGLATIIHHLGDPAWDFQTYYLIDARPLPSWGFYGPVHLLAYGMSVPVAARVVLVAYALLLPYGARTLFSAFGRDPRLGLIAVPLVWNTNLYMGFVSFVVAVPLFLFGVAAAERLLSAEVPRRRDQVWAGVLGVAVYFGHGQVFLLYGCALAVLLLFTLLDRGRPGRWRRAWVFLPALALGVYWIANVILAPASAVGAPEHLEVLGALGVIGKVRWDPLGQNLREMGRYLYDVSPGLLNDVCFAAIFLGLVLGTGWRGVAAVLKKIGGAAWPGLAVLQTLRLELLAAGLLLSYFISPMEIGMQWYVHPRHLLFAALLAPAFLPPDLFDATASTGCRRRGLATFAPLLLVLLSLGVALQAGLTVRAFNREAKGFETVLEQASSGGRTLGLIFDNGGGGSVRVWPFLHFAGYLQARRGGDLGFSFAGLPSLPVRYRPGAQAPHPYEWRPGTFRIGVHGRYYDRYLIRGSPRGDALRLSQGGRKVLRSGAWTLIETPREKKDPAPDFSGTSTGSGRR